ncbi:hypothetical protein [Leptothermofonsia sp. ETS-13]|uniref:hypothetical protein n=1 Tax=Leptothermofonsia sp. ETS-13 TaxID=3035696 RepID=UPI003B9DECB2
MRLLGISSDLELDWSVSYHFEALESYPGLLNFFKTIPPERVGLVGLNGEYDHSGLAKRVVQVLHQKFAPQYLEHLHVTQRGAVIVLRGQVHDRQVLTQMVEVAGTVNGTLNVETYGVRLVEI